MYPVRNRDSLGKNNHRQQRRSDHTGDDSGGHWGRTSSLSAACSQSECMAASVRCQVCHGDLEILESTNRSWSCHGVSCVFSIRSGRARQSPNFARRLRKPPRILMNPATRMQPPGERLGVSPPSTTPESRPPTSHKVQLGKGELQSQLTSRCLWFLQRVFLNNTIVRLLPVGSSRNIEPRDFPADGFGNINRDEETGHQRFTSVSDSHPCTSRS